MNEEAVEQGIDSFFVRHSQALTVMSSVEMILQMLKDKGLLDCVEMHVSKYGNSNEENRMVAWNLEVVVSECAGRLDGRD